MSRPLAFTRYHRVASSKAYNTCKGTIHGQVNGPSKFNHTSSPSPFVITARYNDRERWLKASVTFPFLSGSEKSSSSRFLRADTRRSGLSRSLLFLIPRDPSFILRALDSTYASSPKKLLRTWSAISIQLDISAICSPSKLEWIQVYKRSRNTVLLIALAYKKRKKKKKKNATISCRLNVRAQFAYK